MNSATIESASLSDMSLGRHEPNLQLASPLFNRLPGEIRDHIFKFVLRAYYDRSRPFPTNAYYYRPGFRYATKLDTALLRTCRRVHSETVDLLKFLNNEHVEWHGQSRGPGDWTSQKSSHPKITRVHLFMQQTSLERWYFLAIRLDRELSQLKILKITIRHSDWWWWESSESLALDPKQRGSPSNLNLSAVGDKWPSGAWGRTIDRFRSIENLVLELETREGKKPELDAIVARAPGWQFPGVRGRLILDERQTKKKGWIGHRLRKCGFASSHLSFAHLG